MKIGSNHASVALHGLGGASFHPNQKEIVVKLWYQLKNKVSSGTSVYGNAAAFYF